MSDVSAVVVRQRDHPDDPIAVDQRYPDARHATVDPLGHLVLHAVDLSGTPHLVLGMVAAGCWASWRIDVTSPSPSACPPLAPVIRLPARAA